MKQIFSSLFLIGLTFMCHGQGAVKIDLPSATPVDQAKIIVSDSSIQEAEIQPEFQHGQKGWTLFLERNLNINVPYNNDAPKGKYKVVIGFVVYADGNTGKWREVTHQGYGMENEMIRILKKTPKWKPGLRNGKPVNAYTEQTVFFVVQ